MSVLFVPFKNWRNISFFHPSTGLRVDIINILIRTRHKEAFGLGFSLVPLTRHLILLLPFVRYNLPVAVLALLQRRRRLRGRPTPLHHQHLHLPHRLLLHHLRHLLHHQQGKEIRHGELRQPEGGKEREEGKGEGRSGSDVQYKYKNNAVNKMGRLNSVSDYQACD